MSLGHYLFGFGGRVNRAKQWALLLVSLVQYVILSIAFSLTVGFAPLAEVFARKTSIAAVLATSQARNFEIVFCVLFAIGLYIGLAVTTKRLHDRDKSAWWLLIFILLPFILNIPALLQLPAMMSHIGDIVRAAQSGLPPPSPPVETPLVILTRGAASIISLWAFVELYILRGTVGDNRFGSDPLAR